ncbi:peptidase S8 [Flavobacterium rivuli WB 3.3-2 = DSM 21788]|uniref:Peptidase S8 n=1 Tax=Flavobacterium rivuli WB 3.3-2 = DSM 21788 TaxID=1121895 RepID=A0A0A2M234_9FLAO|nr:S8 family serine peptidase [Flavobacterium rivuli]KGO86334.1 peptidase S8 [Flavobacterium rivuli WB 3.3-2 = DSM 21788]
MKKLLLLLLFTVNIAYAQEDAWVYFNDKPDTEFYLANPLEMLSQKSLTRRANQNIALDGQDVPIHADYITAVTNANGITVMAKSKWLNALHIRGSVDDINALTALAFVARIDFADRTLNAQSRGRVAKPQRQANAQRVQQTETTFNYGTSASQVQMLNTHLLHEQNYTGTGITVAVLDNGFPGVNTTQSFARLNDNGLIIGGYNFVQRTNDVYQGGSHGTIVLSDMAGYTEGQLVGTAPDAFYYLFVTEDVAAENPVEESYWVEAAEMADSLGVDVINTSLGYYTYDNVRYSHTYADADGNTAFITRGANVAFSRGMFLVNAAGNSGASEVNPNISVPADAYNTLTVGAVDASRQYAYFSSLGPTYDGRIKPDVMAQGLAAVVANFEGTITTANGTSCASPIMAGAVACLWQALPNKTNAELLQIIRGSADRYNNPDVQYGYGIPDFNLALQGSLGLNDSVKTDYMLYPNPFRNEINITFPGNIKTASLTIFNSLGQRVWEQSIAANNPVFVDALSTGIYSYRIESGADLQTGRLVKE